MRHILWHFHFFAKTDIIMTHQSKGELIRMNNTKSKFNVYDMVIVGMMAAVCYVATYIRIEIPTGVGRTMIHFGNVFCLLSGLLFGGVRGGLSAGLGSSIFDLTSTWVSSPPTTLINKFLMAYVCGKIAYMRGKNGQNFKYNLIACITGSLSYVILYLTSSSIELLLLGNSMSAVFIAVQTKAVVSLVNGAVAVVVAMRLAPIFRTTLNSAGIYRKLSTK